MQGYFLYDFSSEKQEEYSGIDKKVQSQVKAFNKQNISCRFLAHKKEKQGLSYKLRIRLPFSNGAPRWEYLQEFDEMDFLYFRRPTFFSSHAINLLKKIKKRNPKTKIILEVPTYPYDPELRNRLMDIPFLIKDIYNRRQLHKYIDKIVSVGYDGKIFGIDTIKMINGIEVAAIRARITEERSDTISDTINVIAVAMFKTWHGFDRFLEGMGKYYESGGKRSIILHFVGIGDKAVLNRYHSIVNKYNLQNMVVFYGYKSGEELDVIYDMCDVAMISFGTHRKNIFMLSTLKSREYLAKGLPMIGSGKNDIFEVADFPYYLECPSDDTPIVVENVIGFFDSIYIESRKKESIINEIRDYAFNNVDIGITMKPIIEHLLQN